jgi:hypothetical protein
VPTQRKQLNKEDTGYERFICTTYVVVRIQYVYTSYCYTDINITLQYRRDFCFLIRSDSTARIQNGDVAPRLMVCVQQLRAIREPQIHLQELTLRSRLQLRSSYV